MTLENWERNPRDVSLQFLKQLNSSEGNVMEAAIRELRDAPPKVLMRLLDEEMTLDAQAQVWIFLYALGIIGCVLIGLLASVFWLDWLRRGNGMLPVVTFYSVMMCIIKGWAAGASRHNKARPQQAHEQLIAAIRATCDPALVRLILEGNNYPIQSEDGAMTHSEPFPSSLHRAGKSAAGSQ